MKLLAVHPSGLMYTRVFLRLEPLGLSVFEDDTTRCVEHCFETTWSGAIEHADGEVVWGAWLTLGELAERLADPAWPFVPDTRALLAAHRVVYLSMDVEEAVRRTGLNVARPLLAVNPRKQWRELMAARRHLYEEVATAVVPTDGRTPEEVTRAALDALELKEA